MGGIGCLIGDVTFLCGRRRFSLVRWSTREDEWWWNLEESGVFSVMSAYERVFCAVGVEDRWGVEEKRVFGNLWKSLAVESFGVSLEGVA